MNMRISILAVAVAALGLNDASAQVRGRTTSTRDTGRAIKILGASPKPTSASPSAPATPTTPPDDSAVVAEVKTRYSASYNKAMNFCTRLPAQMTGAKLAAGISLGTSAVGTLAAGTALGTGIAKAVKDKEMGKIKDDMDKRPDLGVFDSTAGLDKDKALRAAEDFIKMAPAQRDKLDKDGLLMVAYGLKIMNEQDQAKMNELSKKSAALGTVRTVGNFIAGGASAGSAISAFVGAAQFDNLIKDMNACDSHVRDIKGQRDELKALAPNDALLADMDDIVAACSGLNSRNIGDVKNKLTAVGIISSVGAATGIAGGITSAVAGSKEAHGALGAKDTKGLNIASNVLAGVTTATAGTSTVISGIMLSDLVKNSDTADTCAGAF